MSRYSDDEFDRILTARRELNPWVTDRGTLETVGGHVRFECTCYGACMFCEGGLFACAVCGGLEGALTTHCPGRHVHLDREVYAGRLDFRDGEWVAGPSIQSPFLWTLACRKAGIIP